MNNEEHTTTDSETDTEGHLARGRGALTPAGEESDDTDGHRFVPAEELPLVGDTPGATTGDDDDPDDTEGHRHYARNVGANFDEGPADDRQDAATGESDAAPASDDDPNDPEDTDGHRLYNRNVGVDFDDTDGHRSVPAEELPLVGDTPGAKTGDDDDPDDTEGHKIYARNVGANFDKESADAGQGASGGESGDTPSSDDDPDDSADTDGHKLYRSHIGVDFG